MGNTYNPKNVTIVVGDTVIEGFTDGDFLTLEREADAYSLTIGADGQHTRTKSNNRSVLVGINLLDSSRANDVLNALATIDEINDGGTFNFFMADRNGTSLCEGPNAFIMKKPALTFGTEASTRSWQIKIPDADILVGSIGSDN